MTISSIAPINGHGLTYYRTQLNSMNSQKSFGDVIIHIQNKQGMLVHLNEKGLSPNSHYGVFWAFRDDMKKNLLMGDSLGDFKTDQLGRFKGTFKKSSMVAIPEIGMYVVIAKVNHPMKPGQLFQIPNRSVSMEAKIAGITSILQETETGLLDSRYLVVGYISAVLPFEAKQAADYYLSPEKYYQGDKHHFTMWKIQKKNHVDLQIGIHVFDMINGTEVRSLPVHLFMHSTTGKSYFSVTPLIAVYNQQYGLADTNLANSVSVGYGSYSMGIQLGHHYLKLPGFIIDETSNELINPLQAKPVAIVIEKNGEFSSKIVKIKKNQKVRFLYDGIGYDAFAFLHNRSSLLKRGQYWDYVFSKKGSYIVRLAYAPSVKMRVIVN